MGRSATAGRSASSAAATCAPARATRPGDSPGEGRPPRAGSADAQAERMASDEPRGAPRGLVTAPRLGDLAVRPVRTQRGGAAATLLAPAPRPYRGTVGPEGMA